MIEDTLIMVAEPVIPAWTISGVTRTAGAELQRAIVRGFLEGIPQNTPLVQTFTFKEHGEFFRGAMTMAGLRYAGDFYDLLQRYGTIKVTITKAHKESK